MEARLAIVGTAETEGVDCVYNTFSPTIGFTAIRVLISLMCDPKYDVGSVKEVYGLKSSGISFIK